MYDMKPIREDAAAFDAAMARRAMAPLSAELLEMDEAWRQAVQNLQVMQSARNALAKRIGEAKRAKEDTATLESEGAALRQQMEALELEVPRLEFLLREVLAATPNLLDADVPEGRDEAANKIVKTFGAVKNFGFAPKEHFELARRWG